ncbi:Inner membrane protein yidI [Yersinia pseudotuberculosis]|nr:Inner membrane protein yidI [Yersinia pseudotuberculosis]
MFAGNKFSSVGMLFGVIALLVGIIHFTTGPLLFQQPTLENVVAQKVSAVKKGIIAGLKGEKVTVTERHTNINPDKLLDAGGIVLAVVALVLGVIGGLRKESRWTINGALLFGGGTLAFHALLFGITVVCAILLIVLVISFLNNGLSF